MAKKSQKPNLEPVTSQPRTAEELQKVYNQLSNVLGDKAYRKNILEQEMSLITADMLRLNQEHQSLLKQEVKNG